MATTDESRTHRKILMAPTVNESNSSYESDGVPTLASGDRLNADEYWKRYLASPDIVQAERINGKVYLMSPLRAAHHGDPHALLSGWLFAYSVGAGNLIISDNTTLRMDAENDTQPDLCMRREGGSAWLDQEGYLHGSPELVIEVAGSSASFDFGEKREVYEAAGIQEYLVCETHEGNIAWWNLSGGKYILIDSEQSVLKSRTFPGLWLDIDALHTADGKRMLQTLHRGMRESGIEVI